MGPALPWLQIFKDAGSKRDHWSQAPPECSQHPCAGEQGRFPASERGMSSVVQSAGSRGGLDVAELASATANCKFVKRHARNPDLAIGSVRPADRADAMAIRALAAKAVELSADTVTAPGWLVAASPRTSKGQHHG